MTSLYIFSLYILLFVLATDIIFIAKMLSAIVLVLILPFISTILLIFILFNS